LACPSWPRNAVKDYAQAQADLEEMLCLDLENAAGPFPLTSMHPAPAFICGRAGRRASDKLAVGRYLMATATTMIPDDLLAELQGGGEEPAETLRLAAAFSRRSRGEPSTSQAARLAGMTYGDFLEAAARAKVALYPNLEELAAALVLL
jgi:hypothetical protein